MNGISSFRNDAKASPFCASPTLGPERALDDVLVESRIAEMQHPQPAEQRPDAGQALVTRIARIEDHLEVIRHLLPQRAEACERSVGRKGIERNPRDREPAEDQDDDLDYIGQSHRLETAIERIERRETGERHHRLEHVQTPSAS